MSATHVLALAAAAAVGWLAFVLSRRYLAKETAERYAPALALGAGYLAGYLLLPDRGDLLPRSHWHWTPWLAVGATLLGPVAAARGLRSFDCGSVLAAASIVAACLLAPTYADLQPPRATVIPLLAGALSLLAAALEALSPRFSARAWLAYMTMSAAATTALIGLAVSATFALAAAVATAALAGSWLATLGRGDSGQVRGLGLPFAIVFGGWAFVAGIEPREPQWPLLLLPAAPLALVCFARGPLARLRGPKAIFAHSASIVFVLAIAAALCLVG
jgi:hypothetical protein